MLTVDAQWRASNPNVLTLTYPTGGVTEVKVTKRSVTMADDARGVEFSEYSRVAAADLGGVPEIGAKWVRGKFRLEEGDSKALGIVLEYVLPGDRPDPKYATMKLKYRISLSKDGD
ncbi:hypothetical protein T484DRAFT_1776267 [Baffinella frigidus]|nr:hypothetical protein T484DRAFT_1776267 [Cryptophyta sp. CCMP2293]